MAPSKSARKSPQPSSSKAKGSAAQSSLKAFGFKGGSKGKQAATDDDGASDNDMVVDDGPVKKSGVAKATRPDLSDLPPLTNISEIFKDLVNHIPQFIDFAKRFKGKKIRVATMCSGTESPLLALEQISRTLKNDHQVTLEFEHVFSCEIVPWKQAYIERNFSPPLLFRDVSELGNDEATTAYGAKAEVPLDVDMLIAGTSCVDYSTLNNNKQDLDGSGESGETFRGMMRWVARANPAIIILENVCSAPWDRVKKYVEEEGYSAAFSRFDTKHYYVPHTRTRVYLCAIRIPNDKKRLEKWLEMTRELRRPASAPFDAWLLPTDDPRIQHGREKLVKEEASTQSKRVIDWAKCETRHERARTEEMLGDQRPLTFWNENGSCHFYDYGWVDWASTQVDRVWDLMDISFMRGIIDGHDTTYKSIFWNLSQNVDRQIGSSIQGISPCMTPTMIPYLNFRGGPMLGVESLSLQGLPVDELVLTRETEDNLADLAGNAMSSTVVGAAMLAALCVAEKLIEGVDAEEKEDDAMAVDGEEGRVPGEERITGLDQLTESSLDLAKTGEMPLHDLLAHAEASARLCVCEGRTGMTSQEIWKCKDCGHSACSRCGGRPEHNYVTIDTQTHARLSPLVFTKEVTEALPMCINITGIDSSDLDALNSSLAAPVPSATWKPYRKAVLSAFASEFRFHSLKRQSVWVAVFDSPSAFLELHMDPKAPQWLLFGKADESEPMNSPTRKVLDSAVARCRLSESLLGEGWELALPASCEITITIRGVQPEPNGVEVNDVQEESAAEAARTAEEAGSGDAAVAQEDVAQDEAAEKTGKREDEVDAHGQMDGWEHRLGIQKPGLKDKKVWAKLEVAVAPADQDKLDENISGVYRWLPHCAAANASLHVRVEKPDADVPPLFFFLEAHKYGGAESDMFVFSRTFRRFEYGESRPILASLETSWRQTDTNDLEAVATHIGCKWVSADKLRLKPVTTREAFFATPSSALAFNAEGTACESAHALLTCRVRLDADDNASIWPRDAWVQVDKVHERKTFQSIAFLTDRLNSAAKIGEWQETPFDKSHGNCLTCAPVTPTIHWVRAPKSRGKNSALGIEDAEQAGEYERALKRRPAAFITQLYRDTQNYGYVHIGLNVPTMIHRVVVRLPVGDPYSPIRTSYRITTDYMPPAKLIRPKFILKSNKNDVEHKQPPGFILNLRKEQLRSLTWMLAQEQADVKEFEEEEIVEAILEPLGWRAEAKATRNIRVLGGVLADQVGYGKTAITLALIACRAKEAKWKKPSSKVTHGLIPVKATLITVPAHLVKQWETEVTKFTKEGRFEVVCIYNAANLNKITVENIMGADIVIMASSVFHSVKYIECLGALAGAGALPTSSGRYFRDRLSKSLLSIRAQAKRLETDGATAVWENILKGEKIDTSLHDLPKAQPSKRLRGQKFRDAVQARTEQSSGMASSSTAASAQSEDAKSDDDGRGSNAKRRRIRDVYITTTVADLQKAAANGSQLKSDKSVQSNGRPSRQSKLAPPVAVDSDEDEDDEIVQPKSRGSKAKAKKSKTSASGDDDFDASGAADSNSSMSEAETSPSEASEAESDGSIEDTKGKTKAKPKSKPKPKVAPKAAAQPAKDSKKRKSSAMEEDDKGKKTAKKPKETKPKATAISQDPWKLQTAAVKKDYQAMKNPPMELFHWHRVVTDEYTYVKDEALALIPQLQASHRWVLSGTPPIHDFASVKTIAVFPGIHLGVDDEDENPVSRGSERTAVEKFHSFREKRSVDWYAHRYTVGQRFLDQFVRQNIAEIDEIKFREHIEIIVLPAAERALERELDHTLRAQDMTMRRNKKTQSDRDQRIMKSLRESSSAEEALLKCVAYYNNVQSGTDNAMKACDYVVKVRKEDLADCKKDIYKTLMRLERQRKGLGSVDNETHYQEWIRVTKKSGLGDNDATTTVLDLYERARSGKAFSDGKAGAGNDKSGESSALSEDEDDDGEGSKKKKGKAKAGGSKEDRIWEHRETTHALRQLIREVVGRFRSSRYFEAVRDIQKDESFTTDCPKCGAVDVPRKNISLLSLCGHMGCSDCILRCAKDQVCVHGREKCQPQGLTKLHVVEADTLGTDDEVKDATRHFGKKLEAVVDLIQNRIPKKDRVIMFVQYEDLMKKVAEALAGNKIKCMQLKGDAKKQSEALMEFQNAEGKARVLLLSLEDESASGANLTTANHVIFLSPMFAKSKEHYIATDTQALGRVRRYGQTKTVNCWRFVARDTIDVEVYKRFTGRDLQKEADEKKAEEKKIAEDGQTTDGEDAVSTREDDTVSMQEDDTASVHEVDTMSSAINGLNVDTDSEGAIEADEDEDEREV